jgi:AcrR family transcriptional regulator
VTVAPPKTRDKLIEATDSLMRDGGLSAVTTQSVARAAGVAEGTIYRHFDSRDELIVSTFCERLGLEFDRAADALLARAGHDSVEANLRRFISEILPVYSTAAPGLGMLAADPALARQTAEALRAQSKGPRQSNERVSRYFREEQRIGRVRGDLDVHAATGLVMGICFHHGLLTHLLGEDPNGLRDDEIPAAVAGILARGCNA